MKEIINRFDELVPVEGSAEKIGKYVRKLLVESEPSVPAEYYITTKGRKHKYWTSPKVASLSVGPVDATYNRMVEITPGADISGIGLTHGEVMTAIKVHNATKMIHDLGLIDGRQAFEEFVNAPTASVGMLPPMAESPASAPELVA